MLGILVSLIASALCAVVYVRMYKRDLPEPLGKGKAALPAVLGFFAPIFSTALLIPLGLVLNSSGGASPLNAIPSQLLRSVIGAFLLAGFPEELIKFLLFLLVIKIVKPKKVYEYAMLCAGVGFGFTVLEDALYGGGDLITAAVRIPLFAMHMLFGLLMGLHLGLAAYRKRKGLGGVGKHRFLALFLPILWHTLFDAATTLNPGTRMEDSDAAVPWILMALVVIAISIALQFMLLTRFRKKSAEYCSLLLTEAAPAADAGAEAPSALGETDAPAADVEAEAPAAPSPEAPEE